VFFAQTNELEEAEIVIRKDRQIILPTATRNFEKIPQLPKLEIPDVQKYRFRSFNLNMNPFSPTIGTVGYELETIDSELKNNYIKAGYGNYVTPYLEAYFGSPRAKKFLYNVYVRHMSSQRGPVDDKNSGNSRSEAVVGGQFFDGTNAIEGSLIYNRFSTHYYGYNPVLEFAPDDIEQVYNKFSAKFTVNRTKKNVPYDYHFTTIWGFFKDINDARENKFFFDTGASLEINSNWKAKIDLLATFSNRNDLISERRNYLNLMPRVSYNSDAFDLNVGFNVAGDSDSGRGLGIYPAIEAGYLVSSGVRVFAGYEGTVEMNTFESMARENQWLTRGFDLRNTEKTSDLYGGLSAKLTDGLNLNAKASYASLNDLTFITNDIQDSTRFNVLYDDETVDRLMVSSSLNFEKKDLVRSSLSFAYYSYNLTTLEQAWHRPEFTLDFNNTFYPMRDLVLTVDFYYMAGLVGLNGETAQAQDLPDIYDLNLGGRYSINPRIGVFLKFNNLFGKEYQRYLNYPSRGLQVLGGVSFTF
jgi:hypothetical protein